MIKPVTAFALLIFPVLLLEVASDFLDEVVVVASALELLLELSLLELLLLVVLLEPEEEEDSLRALQRLRFLARREKLEVNSSAERRFIMRW